MREEIDQAIIPQPVVPVDAPLEPRNRPRWMRYFFTGNASPGSASLTDLQRRACWIGVALILQALNEVTLLVLVYFPLVPPLAPWAGLISFGLITGSLIALWMAFRPATLSTSQEKAESPRRWQRVVLILLLISTLAGVGELVTS